MVVSNRLIDLDLHILILSKVNNKKKLILSEVKINNLEVSSTVADHECSCYKNFENLQRK